MAKILGWIFILLGIALIIVKLAFKQLLGKVPFLANLNILWVVIVGLILIATGMLFLKQGKEKQAEEVPIYEGKKIVGYRRR